MKSNFFNILKDNRNIKNIVILVLMVFLCLAGLIISLENGAVKLSPQEIFRAIFVEKDTTNHQVIWNVRLPRALTGALVGICLSLSGVILQGVMGNPLASPGILGISSGAGLAAFIIFILFPNLYFIAPIAAFLGALGTAAVVYLLAWDGGLQPLRLILSGVAVSSILSGGINALMIFYPERAIGVYGFMVGGLSAKTWHHFKMILPYAFLGSIFSLLLAKKLNILLLGDETAISLGLRVEKVKFIFIILSALLAASAVSVAGLLSFVGLIVPHIARLLTGGADHKYLLPASILLGAFTVMICDTIGRVIISPVEIPVGIIMSTLGAPFFLYLLAMGRSRRGGKK
ncbi:MAG TPA: iron ABC transporter permease [Clostridiales bacterium]|nr:iron ABC transporter permease [Clostridiales bacterium]